MKYRNIIAILLFGAVLSLGAWPLAADTGNKTVLLKVHVPSTAG